MPNSPKPIAPTDKHRPSLTESDIAHILLLAKESTHYPASVTLIKKLTPFLAKIQVGAVTPAFSSITKESLESQLGMTTGLSIGLPLGMDTEMLTDIDKLEYAKKCYELYISNPPLCTEYMIDKAREHMFLNDLMNKEEEEEYMNVLGSTKPKS